MPEETGAQTPATTMVHLLRRQAARYRDKVAFHFSWYGDGDDATQLTYHELDVKARAIASDLQQQGAAGQRAAVLCRPGLDFIAGFFGCLYAGVTPVPAHIRLNPYLNSVVADAHPSFVLATSRDQAALKDRVDALVDGRPLRWYTTDEVAGDAGNWVMPDIDAATPALIQYTSGTTSAPKGVVVTHRNLLSNLAAIHATWNGDDRAVGVYWLPQHHDLGLIAGTLVALYAGCTNLLMAPVAFIERPMRWLEAISQQRAFGTAAPNFGFKECIERSTAEERAAVDLSSLSVVYNGGDPIPAATLRAFAEAFASAGFRPEAFVPAYGLAEATLMVSCGSDSPLPVVAHIDRTALGEGRVVDATPAEHFGAAEFLSCGRPHPDQQVLIVDPETRRPCGADEVGEIWISGPCVAREYWRRPEETEQTFGARLADTGEGPFLRTGDMGFLRSGELFIAGRYQDLILIAGRYYYPNDIELTVQGCDPALAAGRGAAFAVTPEPDGTEQLVVVQEVDPRRADGADLAAASTAIHAAIARHHGLDAHAVVLVEFISIPTTSSAKIQRSQCRQRFLDGTLNLVADRHESPSSAS